MAEKRDKQPWMKWFWADWKSGADLRSCSLAARGLWAEMLAVMDEAYPYGHLLINGKKLTDQQLANQAGGGATKQQIARLTTELEDAGVFSRTEDGTIYCRRMVRDKQKADEDRENGKRGGNPRLKGGDNPPLNPDDNGDDKAQKPEARCQKPDANSTPIAPKGARKRAKVKKPTEYSHAFNQFWDLYPHKVAKDAAWKAWLKLIEQARMPAPDVLAAAIATYVATKPADRAWANPSTWLNGGRWMDAPATEVTASAVPTPSEPPPELKGWRLAFWRAHGDTAYRSWVEGSEVSRNTDGIVTMLQPTRFRCDHVRNNFADKLLRLMQAEDAAVKILKIDVRPAAKPEQGERAA